MNPDEVPTGEAANADRSAELVRRVLEGETEVYSVLVRQHQRDVYRVLAALLRDAAATENLVQQTFIQAFERLDQFRQGRDFAAWVKGIARHLALDELRRAAAEARRLDHYRDYVLALAGNGTALEERERRLDDALAACRQALAPTAARALALRYEQALDLDAVASALGRTVGATMQLLFRTRATVKQCIEGRLAPE